VVREVSDRTAFPVLTKNDYSDWAMLMRVMLKVCGLWVTVDKGCIDPQEDMMVLDALVLAVPSELVVTVADKSSVKEAWDGIATMQVGDEPIKKAAVQQLRNQFDRTTFKEGESMEEFTLQMNSMVATLATLGDIMEECKVMEKILCCVARRMRQIALAITTLLDVQSLIIANLAERFKVAEEAFKELPSSMQLEGKLYLTEEEWDAHHAQHESENLGSGGAGSGGSRAGSGRSEGHGDRGRGRGHRRGHGMGSGGRGPQKTDECHRCGKLGHWARECHANAKKDQAHAIQDDRHP
jgi:hypothetical protein